MKKILMLTCFFVMGYVSFGQTEPSENKLSNLIKADIGLQGIELTFEPRLSKHLTTDLSLGLGGGYAITKNSLDFEVLKPATNFSVTPKYFYNIKKRINRGKTVLYNSGNYLGIRFKYNTPLHNKLEIIRKSILANIHWGMQRAIGPHWSFGSLFGLGYAQDVEYNFGTIYPALEFRFSYVFSRENK